MRKRHGRKFGRKSLKNIHRFFLACEFKPHTPLWSVLDPFAYDLEPAYIRGKLGIVSYKPRSYAIVTVDDEEQPLVGYSFTITHPDTILLLDKIKGCNGKNAFSSHAKKLAFAWNDEAERYPVWCYVLTPYVIDAYAQIEQVPWGFWDNDAEQQGLLDHIARD